MSGTDAGAGAKRAQGRTAPPTLRIRPMEAGDVARVAEIEAATFSSPWKPATFRRLLKRPTTELWAAELPAHGVVGYFVAWFVLDEAELANLAVAEAHRNAGIGSALLDRVLERAGAHGARNLFLEVRASNAGAARLYERRGFGVIAVRRDYYDRPQEDALVMMKSLW